MKASNFWSYVKENENGCLLWTNAHNKKGYGQAWFNGKNQAAHRVAWQIENGEIPEGYDIHHLPTCDKACCNTEHLQLIKHAEHTKITNSIQIDHSKTRGVNNGVYRHPERVARGDRHGSRTKPGRLPKGEKHYSKTQPEKIIRGSRIGTAKLSEDNISEIFALREQGIFQRVIGEKFGVTQSCISDILRGRWWKHAIPK